MPTRAERVVDYRRLVNPFPPVAAYTEHQVQTIHDNSLRLLSERGIRMLLPEARQIMADSGARVDEEELLVFLDPDQVMAAVESAPSRFEFVARNPERNVPMGGAALVFAPVGGPPHYNDLDVGKRPGTAADFELFVKLTQAFDVIHLISQPGEAQDWDVSVRHLITTRMQITQSDKVPFVYSRGRLQVADCFEMLRIAHGVDDETFAEAPRCYTVINTNSPRQIDIPMSLGLIDFARAGQACVITPFTLAGAMAPVTLPGALTLQHAEALAAITLNQTAGPGAPVVYGGFTSNVDMKSGSPAFGTPEYVRAAHASGQLARLLDLPWRSSMPNASNIVDAQATYETALSMFGAVLGGANFVLHSAGWMEGGLTASPEKFIIDVEMLQAIAELCAQPTLDDGDFAYDALAGVEPGGHFFGIDHTMERYETAFYQPIVSDWSNFGQWTENGALTATERANRIWKETIASFEPPPFDTARSAALDHFVERRLAEGGAAPD